MQKTEKVRMGYEWVALSLTILAAIPSAFRPSPELGQLAGEMYGQEEMAR